MAIGPKANVVRNAVMRAREIRTQPYWETIAVPATAVDQVFFQTLPATAAAGNMQTPGQFPSPRQFLVKGFSVYAWSVVAATGIADMNATLNSCFIFSISDKEYLRFLGWMAPGGGGMNSAFTTSATPITGTFPVTNGWPVSHNYFRVEPAILIPQQQNFRVVQTARVAPTAAVNVTVVMWGTEERAVQ